MTNYLIKINNLSKLYSLSKNGIPQNVLNNINLQIPHGCIYGIIGMSGAGKSTLLRCLAGLESFTEGEIIFQENEIRFQDSRSLANLRKHVGMIFQHFHLFSSRTVSQNISYPLEIAGQSLIQRQKRIEELLKLVNLETKHAHYPSQLSGGEKQRVAIARALAPQPLLLLCDEPTSALDPKTTFHLLELLKELNQILGLTIIVITHDLETVKQICHRVAVLAHGQIVEEGEVKEIFSRPQHPVTQHLLRLSFEQVPSDLLQQQKEGFILTRLGFEGRQAKEPVLSHMLKRFEVEANILAGGLDCIQDTIIGHLFVELSGKSDELDKALTYLRNQQIVCEVLR